MDVRRLLSHPRAKAAVLIGMALSVSGLFKVAAFAREAFIATQFGLSNVTDAYFALQQLPMTLSTYVYGAFSLAFVPAFLRAHKEHGRMEWLPGLAIWGLTGGALFTAAMVAGRMQLLRILHIENSPDVSSTAILLSFCFVPIVAAGIWSEICNARGQNLRVVTMMGSPYLIMTLVLFGAWAIGKLDNLSLPFSMLAGFTVVGIYSVIRIAMAQKLPRRAYFNLAIWRHPEFRQFFHQLGASSTENVGYALNQLLLTYFLSRAGTGAISGNTCAMRVATLAYTLLGMPIAQLVNAKLCKTPDEQLQQVFRRWLLIVTSLMVGFSAFMFLFRFPLVRLIYMHGRFKDAALHIVVGMLPAWITYIFITTVNSVLARYLFIMVRGSTYFRNQIVAYVTANVLRVIVVSRFPAPWLIWSSVAAEGVALLWNLKICLTLTKRAGVAEPLPQLEVVA